jgi:ankyrin repeat protein
VDLLLDAGAEIDARDIDHRSTAAEWMTGDVQKPEESRHDLAKYLVDRGASVDIFLAAALGLTEQARSMVERDSTLLGLRTAQGEYGERPPSSYHIYHWTLGANRSPLQVAADRGHDETMRAMLAFAEPGERLLLACHLGQEGVARAIVRDHPGLVQRLTPVQARALTDAAWEGKVSTIELMLDLGFDPSITGVTGPTAGTALHGAAWKGSVPIVKALLRHPKARSLLEVRDAAYGGTPLSWCGHGSRNSGEAEADHAAVAQLLIDAGAHVDPHLLDWTGTNAYKEVVARALGTR